MCCVKDDPPPYPQNVDSKRGYAMVIGNGNDSTGNDIRETCHKDADVMADAFKSAGKKNNIMFF